MSEQEYEFAEEDIRCALDTMIFPFTRKHPSALLQLWSVSEFILHHHMPDTLYNRQFAIDALLVSLITEALIKHRRNYGLAPPDIDHTFNQIPDQIVQDMQCANQELTCWMLLYYRYVRVDLNISVAWLAETTALTERSIRRFIEHGVCRLTHLVLAREYLTHSKFRHHRLLNALPPLKETDRLGRQDEVHALYDWMSTRLPCHVHVSGEAGIGKTHFVNRVVRQLINQHAFDQVIWIPKPTSLQTLHTYFPSHEDLSGMKLALQDYATIWRQIVVLDGIDQLPAEHIEQLLGDLRFATVFVISRAPRLLKGIDCHYEVGELNQGDAIQLIKLYSSTYYRQEGWHLADQEIKHIWSQVGGHPLRIQEAVHHYWKQAECVEAS